MARDATAGHTMPEGFGAVRDLAIACIRDEEMDRLTGWPCRMGAFREEPMTTENLSADTGFPSGHAKKQRLGAIERFKLNPIHQMPGLNT